MLSWMLVFVCVVAAWAFLRILGGERERQLRDLETKREIVRREIERREAAAAAVVQASRPAALKASPPRNAA
jgi:hypothetical protein